jgi:hypothetical protein
MVTTNNLRPKRNTKGSATRAQRARRVTPESRTGTGAPAPATRTAEPPAHRAPSTDGRPRGHVVGHAFGDPPPVMAEGLPRGHVVGHAFSQRRTG